MAHVNAAPEHVKVVGNRFYDTLKFCALIAFPAFGAAYFSLAAIWNLPYAEQVVGTVTVIDTALGVILGIAKNNYDNNDDRFDGSIDVVPNEKEETTDLNFSVNHAALASGKRELAIKVNHPGNS